jgi:hypothetical protein
MVEIILDQIIFILDQIIFHWRTRQEPGKSHCIPQESENTPWQWRSRVQSS